jgi:hypothetical protein
MRNAEPAGGAYVAPAAGAPSAHPLARGKDYMDKKQEIIQEIKMLANKVSPRPLTQQYFKSESTIPLGTLQYQFGTFNKAVEAAGLKPNPSGIPAAGRKLLTEDELFDEIARLWRLEGCPPNKSILNAEGKYSSSPYKKRWGSFSNAVDEYRRRHPEMPTQDTLMVGPRLVPGGEVQTHVVIPATHKPQSATAKKRLLYGEPLDFRGLRYAPVNEQGVVYLFGMVSRELGFLIESIRTEYPDCEGKRCTEPDGTAWEHVRIEFEHRSSNFKEHGHNAENCELIVCWIHDWKDCPIEVLELRSEIKKLTRN